MSSVIPISFDIYLNIDKSIVKDEAPKYLWKQKWNIMGEFNTIFVWSHFSICTPPGGLLYSYIFLLFQQRIWYIQIRRRLAVVCQQRIDVS